MKWEAVLGVCLFGLLMAACGEDRPGVKQHHPKGGAQFPQEGKHRAKGLKTCGPSGTPPPWWPPC